MSASFTKLFSSIITSTVWREDLETKVTWVTLLALADQHGEVQGSLPGLAHLAGVSIEGCKRALELFMQPDEYSRTKDHEGRRIEEIPGGWAILNYAAYRRLASKEEAIEKTRERVRRHRERKAGVTLCNAAKRPVTQNDTEAEAEAEADYGNTDLVERGGANAPRANEGAKNGRGTRLPDDWQPSADERGFASDLGMDPDATASSFRDYWVAVAGAKGRKADWPATWRNWCRRDAERRQPSGSLGPLGQGKARRFQPPRGNDAFYEQLADIARRADD